MKSVQSLIDRSYDLVPNQPFDPAHAAAEAEVKGRYRQRLTASPTDQKWLERLARWERTLELISAYRRSHHIALKGIWDNPSKSKSVTKPKAATSATAKAGTKSPEAKRSPPVGKSQFAAKSATAKDTKTAATKPAAKTPPRSPTNSSSAGGGGSGGGERAPTYFDATDRALQLQRDELWRSAFGLGSTESLAASDWPFRVLIDTSIALTTAKPTYQFPIEIVSTAARPPPPPLPANISPHSLVLALHAPAGVIITLSEPKSGGRKPREQRLAGPVRIPSLALPLPRLV